MIRGVFVSANLIIFNIYITNGTNLTPTNVLPNSQFQWWWELIAKVVVINQTTIRSCPRRPWNVCGQGTCTFRKRLNTHYVHSVLVQNVVSGRACCVNQYQYESDGDYIFCLTSCYFFRSFTNVTLLCFVSHSNDMTSCQISSAYNASCNVAPFLYHHSVVIQHLVRDTLYQTGDFVNFKGKRT